MPVPKKKMSKGRRDRRRAHDALKATSTSKCPHCGKDKLSHRACPECGKYREKLPSKRKEKSKKPE